MDNFSHKKQYLMALDAGTGAARCFLISTDGSQKFQAYKEWTYLFPEDAQPGGMEFDPETFWKIISDLVKEVLNKNSISPDQILAVSSSSQREGFVLLDRDGVEVYAGPNTDMRHPKNYDLLMEMWGEELYQNSGHWPLGMFAPFRLLWIKENRPRVFENSASLLMINDWILYRLSGAMNSEPSNAVETLLYNVREGTWNRSLIKKLGLNEDLFKEVVPSGTLIGYISEKASKETGLLPGTPVVTGGADTQCGVFGAGSHKHGEVSTICGSYAQSVMVLDSPIVDEQYRAWSGKHIVANKWVLESSAMETGQAFRYVRDVFYGETSAKAYQIMDQEASLIPSGSNGVLSFIGPRLPDYRNFRFEIQGAFYLQLPPLPSSGSRAAFSRSVLESVAYAIRANIERLETITGSEMQHLNVCGGMTRSNTFRDILSNVIHSDLFVAEEVEGTAIGAALCAGVGANVFPSLEDASDLLIKKKIQLPTTNLKDKYDNLYKIWLEKMPEAYGFDL